MDEPEQGAGAGIAGLGQRPRQLERGGVFLLLISGEGGAGIVAAAEAPARAQIERGLPERPAIGTEHEAGGQSEHDDRRLERRPQAPPEPGRVPAAHQRRLQPGDLLLQFGFVRRLLRTQPSWQQLHGPLA